jgi:hypothetical protein
MLPGFLIAFFLSPMNEPIITNGEEQQIQRISRDNSVVNGTAPDDPSIVKKAFIMMNIVKANEGYSSAVYKAFISHSLPLNIL